MFDPTERHPKYSAFAPSWALMRDAMDGEDRIKSLGETYLPMKSGTRAMTDPALRAHAYETYKVRAEFPELVAPTVRGAVGVMLDKPAEIELPAAMEPLRERATRDGMTLDSLHRRIATEVMVTGRYGLLPGISEAGDPYLAGYVAEAIVNWDGAAALDFLMLDESGVARDRETGKWGTSERYRECYIDGNAYQSRTWEKASTGAWVSTDAVIAADRRGRTLPFVPFVFIDTSDLTADPDDVPLYGLAKLAVRVYRLDADYTFALHMTSEPTPVAIGFDDPQDAVKSGRAPTTLGSSKLWLLPPGGDAKYLEFSGPGLDAQAKAIAATLDRAVLAGAQLLSDSARTAESGEAIRLRMGNQHATLKSVATTSAAGLERALRNLAVWLGENPDQVKVEPNTDFFGRELTGQEVTAIVDGWQRGAYSWRTAFDRLKRGGVIPDERTPEDELDLMDEDSLDPVETDRSE